MENIIIRQAELNDVDKLMIFIDTFWKKDHILAINKEFFLYEFLRDNKLNIILAEDKEEIKGFFGYFYYNSDEIPHMSGSIWKIHPEVKDQLLGIKIREYFKKIVKHDFFATPGPGIHMKPVYKILRMNWFRMNQFYVANDLKKEYKLVLNPRLKKINEVYNDDVKIIKAKDETELRDFIFDDQTVPKKDLKYLKRRYFNHLIYKYNIYYLKNEDKIKNIIICRDCHALDEKALRIVDFFGDLTSIKEIVTFFYNYIKENNYEYFDFICKGYDEGILKNAGFSELDLDNESTIVPNYFEPFIRKNISIYCVCDQSEKNYRQHKADGDMDRPNTAY